MAEGETCTSLNDLMVMLSKVEANNLVHYGNQNQTGKKSYFPSLVDKYPVYSK